MSSKNANVTKKAMCIFCTFQIPTSLLCIIAWMSSYVLIDNYIDVDTLTMLSNRNAHVSATIYTRHLSQQQQLDVQRHNQQYPPIAVNYCQRNHDRFLIIDDVVYVFGASLKDAGKKLFAYIRMQETSASELLNNIRYLSIIDGATESFLGGKTMD